MPITLHTPLTHEKPPSETLNPLEIPAPVITDARKIQLSFEVLGSPHSTSAYEQYAHAFRTVFENLEPSFVSIGEAPVVAEDQDKTYESIVGTATEHGPASKVVPIVRWDGREQQEVQEELERYAQLGVETLLVSPSKGELKGEGADSGATVSTLLHLARDIKKFQAIGLMMRAEQFPELEHLDYSVLAGRLELADFGVTQPLMYAKPYDTLVKVMAAAGVPKPISPGLMPFKSVEEAKAYAAGQRVIFAPNVEEEARVAALRYGPGDKQSRLRNLLVRYSVELAHGFIESGAPSLHVYTKNNVRLTQEVVEKIRG